MGTVVLNHFTKGKISEFFFFFFFFFASYSTLFQMWSPLENLLLRSTFSSLKVGSCPYDANFVQKVFVLFCIVIK